MKILELTGKLSATIIVRILLVVQSFLLIVLGRVIYANKTILGDSTTIVVVIAVAIVFMCFTGFYMHWLYQKALRPFSELSENLGKGNFTFVDDKNIEDTKNEAALIYHQLNLAVAKTNEKVTLVMDDIRTWVASSNKISATSEDLSLIVDKQTQNTEVVNKAIEEMVYTIVGNSAINAQAAQCSKQSGDAARNGGEVVLRTIAKIRSISQVVEQSVQMVEKLNGSCDDIGGMVSTISAIASQTNLLALNAAIEAARAGEQGRGFAVVADEVRSLANNTTAVTRQIEDAVKAIQAGAVDTAEVMKQAHSEVAAGITLADEAGHALEDIVGETKTVLDMINEIASAGDETANTATDKTAFHLDRVSTVTGESAAFVESAAKKTSDLRTDLAMLREMSKRVSLLLVGFKAS